MTKSAPQERYAVIEKRKRERNGGWRRERDRERDKEKEKERKKKGETEDVEQLMDGYFDEWAC